MNNICFLTAIGLAISSAAVQAESTGHRDFTAAQASQAAAEALASCERLGHKVTVTVLDRAGQTRAVLKLIFYSYFVTFEQHPHG